MSDIRLYIGGSEVDFSIEESPILFQRQRTDYTNPTIVKNSFTKTITLPGTNSNNQIFNNLWKLDRTQWTGAFNPSKRVEFLLLKNGSLVEKGYVKLDNIVWDGKSYTYQVTLYGELGNVLYELSYYTDPETDEVRNLNVGDLDWGFGGFYISKDAVIAGWTKLANGTGNEVWTKINFMVSYDGIPQATNFDPQKMLVSVGQNITTSTVTYDGTGDRRCAGVWDAEGGVTGRFDFQKFPYQERVGAGTSAVIYKGIDTMLSRMDPDDHYGLLDLERQITPVEARDFRSYLLRPVMSVKGLFEAIGSYINTNLGYTLDLSDPFFSTDDFTKTWITLSMLYEVMPEVESYSPIYKQTLFSNTSTPASYLISYCKIYGIYLDVDFVTKTFKLTRLPNFFDGTVETLVLNKDNEIKITPLSFDKSSYTFDYSEGEGEFLEKYKNTYGVNYGIKRVNTGYRFDASSMKYIDNNIFKEGLDVLEQSDYYRYTTTYGGSNLIEYPKPFTDFSKSLTYKLFNRDSEGKVTTLEGPMTINSSYSFRSGTTTTTYDISNSGYVFLNETWRGIGEENGWTGRIWQDAFPKLQFHTADNSGSDGKDVLVKFNGITNTRYGTRVSTNGKVSYLRVSGTDNTLVWYLVSDDNYVCKDYLGVNCYYDCPNPSVGFGDGYISKVVGIPSFTRCTYDYTRDTSKIPYLKTNSFGGTINESSSAVDVTSYSNFFRTIISAESARAYPYANVSLVSGHKYFIAASVSTNSYSDIISGGFAYPAILDGTLVSSKNLEGDRMQVIGSIMTSVSSAQNRVMPLAVFNAGHSVSFLTYYMVIYDLTEMGLEDKFSTAAEVITYFGLTPYKIGYDYNVSDTLDFGVGREIYVPACTVTPGVGIYNTYWGRYIEDIYSVNTRVFDCYCFLPNISDVFRKFYYYDNSLWVLSKVVDWSDDSKLCKATFIKVNNKTNYTT